MVIAGKFGRSIFCIHRLRNRQIMGSLHAFPHFLVHSDTDLNDKSESCYSTLIKYTRPSHPMQEPSLGVENFKELFTSHLIGLPTPLKSFHLMNPDLSPIPIASLCVWKEKGIEKLRGRFEVFDSTRCNEQTPCRCRRSYQYVCPESFCAV